MGIRFVCMDIPLNIISNDTAGVLNARSYRQNLWVFVVPGITKDEKTEYRIGCDVIWQ